jgi:methyl-accepting chemotaxis protein
LSELFEGIVIVGIGFKYITSLFEKTNDKIHELTVPFGKISKVVTVIENIRIQTNMLAVCGTIEAARAGEHGKGFAFVGGDIKNLASETKENNEKIRDLLDQIYELLDQAKKDFSEVNLLIITQDQEANVSLDFLTQFEKMITQSGIRSENIKPIIERITAKSEKFSSNNYSINNLFDKVNKILQDNNELVNTFFKKTDELEKKLDSIEVSLLSEE